MDSVVVVVVVVMMVVVVVRNEQSEVMPGSGSVSQADIIHSFFYIFVIIDIISVSESEQI